MGWLAAYRNPLFPVRRSWLGCMCFERWKSKSSNQVEMRGYTGSPTSLSGKCPKDLFQCNCYKHISPQCSKYFQAYLYNTSSLLSKHTYITHPNYNIWKIILKTISYRNSLVVQWSRFCLPTQGTQVQSLVREDPTCHRATKPNTTAPVPVLWSLCSTARDATTVRSPRSPQLGKARSAVKTQCNQKKVNNFFKKTISLNK